MWVKPNSTWRGTTTLSEAAAMMVKRLRVMRKAIWIHEARLIIHGFFICALYSSVTPFSGRRMRLHIIQAHS